MVEPWYMVQALQSQPMHGQLSNEDLLKLRRFYTQQLALAQALLEAKLPGICKTTTSVENQSLEEFLLMEGEANSISSNDDSKETF